MNLDQLKFPSSIVRLLPQTNDIGLLFSQNHSFMYPISAFYKIGIFFVSILLFSPLSFSQEMSCLSTLQWHEDKLENDAVYKRNNEEWKSEIEQIIAQRNPNCEDGPILIPVAVHFDSGANLPTTAGEKECAIEMAIDQIANLNLEYAGEEPDALVFNDNLGSCFGTTVGNACIQFCLAKQNHPEGWDLEDGDYAVTFGLADFDYPQQFGFPAGSPTNSEWAGYINIYVLNLPAGLLGISNGIPGDFNGDGVMLDVCQFGTDNIDCSGFDNTNSCGAGGFVEGETITHELGHFLGLFHIWGDEIACQGGQSQTQCSGSDNIDDTPNISCSYSGFSNCNNFDSCEDLPATCGSSDMTMNFMGYATDPCMYMFTSGQADVMYATAIQKGFTTNIPPQCGDPTCPAEIISQYNAEEIACSNLGIYELPDDFPGLEIDDPSGAIYIWSTGDYIESGGSLIDGSIYELIGPSTCNPEEQEIFLNISCKIDSTLFFEGGSITLTVYPDLSELDTELFASYESDICVGPTWTINPDCESFVVEISQISGPEFPILPGFGDAEYEITVSYPALCCDVEGTGATCSIIEVVEYACPFIPGCTNPEACNYNAAATIDDESCILELGGCNTGIAELDNISINAMPNPVSDLLYFKLDLPTAYESVEIKVYSINGQLLEEVLSSSQINQGQHQITYDVKNLVTGVYFYKLIIDNKVISTKKITVSK